MAYPFIPDSTYAKMRSRGVSEKEVYDVWSSGENLTLPGGSKAIKKRYETYGFEVGLTYAMIDNGQYMITGVWKRNIF